MDGSLTPGGTNWTAYLELFYSGKLNKPTGTYNCIKYSLHGPQEKQSYINLLKPTGHVMHQQFNIQQLYALPTLYLCFVYI